MPAAEIEVNAALVRRLLASQHTDLAHLELSEIANGWDNMMFRLGSDYTVRIPRREVAAPLIVNEARWLKGLAKRLPISIPEPVRTGQPTEFFPWPWNICPWFEGEVAARSTLSNPLAEAETLAEFLVLLHIDMAGDGPKNPWRAGPLSEVEPRFKANLAILAEAESSPDRDPADRDADLDLSQLLERWHDLSQVPEWSGPPQFVHGDLHTANVLVHEGSISAVIDFGDVTTGDPAVDFAIAWMLFDNETRRHFRQAADVGDHTWARAEAWALHFACVYLAHSADNPLLGMMGRHLIGELTSEL